MATCTDVAAFLNQANERTITQPLGADDLTALQQLNLIRRLTADDVKGIESRVSTTEAARLALAQETQDRQRAGAAVEVDTRKSHSILFHLEGVDSQHSLLEGLQREQAALQALDADLAKRQQEFAQLLVDKALLDSLSPMNGGFIGITTQGRVALRDLNARLYRVGEQPFAKYWDDATRVDGELVGIATSSAQMLPFLVTTLGSDVERAYVWAIAIGLVKSGGDLNERLRRFVDAHQRVKELSGNLENVLMAAEILSAAEVPPEQSVGYVHGLMSEVAELGVPEDAQLGVASILFLGERADGTFPTSSLQGFLTKTPSFEAAGLLSVVNTPFEELAAKFADLKQLFAGWGFSASEDTEIASAYLAISDLPVEGAAPKLAILSRGLAGYLQFPLVASAILASIPVLEANETLNLMEKAYEIVGQRTGPMTQAELISLAVRVIHGVEVRSVDEIDTTAKVTPTAPGFSYAGVSPRIWMPVFIAHGAYYSTFSGIGGIHPGHVHVWGGGGFTG